jgi:hypothetical protein
MEVANGVVVDVDAISRRKTCEEIGDVEAMLVLYEMSWFRAIKYRTGEPPRVSWRPLGLSQADMDGCSI